MMSQLILFQGDSITDAHRDRANDHLAGNGYPTLVKGRLGYEAPGAYTFLNRGIGGNRVVDLYARIKVDIINLHPDWVSVLIGVNDVWHEVDSQNGVAADKFERIYDMMLEEIRQALPNVKLMVLEPFVLPGVATVNTEAEPQRWETFQREVALRAAASQRVAQKHHAGFVPLQQRFDEVYPRAERGYWLVDGVHPSAMGHELIARAWVETFKAMGGQL